MFPPKKDSWLKPQMERSAPQVPISMGRSEPQVPNYVAPNVLPMMERSQPQVPIGLSQQASQQAPMGLPPVNSWVNPTSAVNPTIASPAMQSNRPPLMPQSMPLSSPEWQAPGQEMQKKSGLNNLPSWFK